MTRLCLLLPLTIAGLLASIDNAVAGAPATSRGDNVKISQPARPTNVAFVEQRSSAVQRDPLSRPTVRVGDTLYLSAQGNQNLDSGKRSLEMGAATRQAMLNLKRGLDAEGFTFSDVVASHVWVTDLGKYHEMNNVYRSFFDQQFPTRTTVGVAALPGGSNVQIAMVAFKGHKKVIYPKGAKKSGLPFSPGILAGDTLYLSGQAGIDPRSGKLVKGDMGVHVMQTLKNIQGVLNAAGLDYDNVVSSYVFVNNVDNFGEASNAYLSIFTKEPRPARVPMGAAKLPLNSPVEITMIASKKPRQAIVGKGQSPSGGYSRGLLTGDVIHLAGIYRRDGTMQDQVDSCVDWVKPILKAAEMGLEDVVEIRIYLADINDYAAMSDAYRQHFPNNPPALSVIAVPRVLSNLRIMMGVVAVKKSAK